MSTTLSPNRYARDWNGYSEHWDRSYGRQYAHLGDEWNDDGTSERARDELYFAVYAKRWLKPDMTVLEVGPGGGKWTVRIAPFVKNEDRGVALRDRGADIRFSASLIASALISSPAGHSEFDSEWPVRFGRS
jgi:hypothetical protein